MSASLVLSAKLQRYRNVSNEPLRSLLISNPMMQGFLNSDLLPFRLRETVLLQRTDVILHWVASLFISCEPRAGYFT